MTSCSDLGAPVRLKADAEVSATALDFGTIAVGSTATRSVTVESTGNASVSGSVSIACHVYTVLSGGGTFSLGPGEKRTIQAPGAKGAIVPDSIEFGYTPTTQSHSGMFQIYSIGAAPLHVNVVSPTDELRILSGGGPSEIPAGGSLTVLFSAHIQTIFSTSCDQACHSHIFKDPNTAYRNLIQYQYVIPGDPDDSYLYSAIYYNAMPQGGPPLSQADKNKFRDWILQGATNY